MSNRLPLMNFDLLALRGSYNYVNDKNYYSINFLHSSMSSRLGSSANLENSFMWQSVGCSVGEVILHRDSMQIEGHRARRLSGARVFTSPALEQPTIAIEMSWERA